MNNKQNIIVDARNKEECKKFEVAVIRQPLSDQRYTIKFTDKFRIHTDGVHGLLNIYLQEVYAYYNLPLKLRAKLIYSGDYSKGVPDKYRQFVCDNVINILPDREIHLYFLLGMVVACFHQLSMKLSITISMDHSLWGYLDAYDNHKEFRELLDNPIITEKDPPWVVQQKEDEIVRILKDAEVYPINLMFEGGVKINAKQAQALVQIGPMPGYIDKNRTQHNVLGGILNGIRLPKDLYQMDNSGRLVIISGKTEVKDPGTINKHIGIPLATFKLNEDLSREVIHDCGTMLTLPWHVKGKEDLKFLRWKYIYKDGKNIGYVNIDREDLIGQDIEIRSALFNYGDTICEECMGYMSDFLQDTKAWKASAYMYVMDVIGAIVQNLISIKHNNSAKMLETHVFFRGVLYTLKEFYEKLKEILLAVEFDWLRFTKGTLVEFIGFSHDFEEKPFTKNWYLKINGEIAVFDTPLYMPESDDMEHKDCIQYYIPNDSVFIKAEDLKIMLKKHNNEPKAHKEMWTERYKNSPAIRTKYFSQDEEYKNMSVRDQIIAFFNYCREVSHFDHIIYYEALIYGLMRDGNDSSKRLSKNSTSVQFYNIGDILRTPGLTNALSVKLHHGYIKNNILVPEMEVEPSEFDVVYNKLLDREPIKYTNESDFADFDGITD